MTEIFHLSHFYFLSSVPLPFPAYLEALNCDDSKSASVGAIPIGMMRIVVNYICIAKLVGAVALWLIVERKDCDHKLNVFATFLIFVPLTLLLLMSVNTMNLFPMLFQRPQ